MPVPYARQSTGPRDRMVRRTSEQPRWRHPRTYRRGSPDTPLLHGWTSPDHDPCANPDPRLSVAYWRRLGSSSHRGKAFATNQTSRNARLDDPFEHPAENIAFTKTLVPSTRERRMIRHSILDTELAEPA